MFSIDARSIVVGALIYLVVMTIFEFLAPAVPYAGRLTAGLAVVLAAAVLVAQTGKR